MNAHTHTQKPYPSAFEQICSPVQQNVLFTRNGSPLQYSCLENPHGQTSLAGYHPWGGTKVRHNLATKQQHLQHLEPQDFMVATTLSVMPFISICHFSSPSLKLAACPLEHHTLQQVDWFNVHIKAFRTDSHLLSRKERGTGIPWRYWGFTSRTPEYSEYHNKVSYTKFLASQPVQKLCLDYTVA